MRNLLPFQIQVPKAKLRIFKILIHNVVRYNYVLKPYSRGIIEVLLLEND